MSPTGVTTFLYDGIWCSGKVWNTHKTHIIIRWSLLNLLLYIYLCIISMIRTLNGWWENVQSSTIIYLEIKGTDKAISRVV